MKLKIVPNNDIGDYFNQVTMFVEFEKKDFNKFRRDVRSSEETMQSAQFSEEHIWRMWCQRKNYHLHQMVRQYYDLTSTQILVRLQDHQYNDERQISINSFVHSSDNHHWFCKDESCTIWHWLLVEPGHF